MDNMIWNDMTNLDLGELANKVDYINAQVFFQNWYSMYLIIQSMYI